MKPVQHVIQNALERLMVDLGEYEQTTHGSLGPFEIESVALALVNCYQNPRGYEVSELSQKIRGLLKESAKPDKQT